MTGSDIEPDPTLDPAGGATPDAVSAHLDPGALKDAHGRTGRMLQNAGLPFEEDEFDEADDDSTSSSSADGDSSSSSSSSSDEE